MSLLFEIVLWILVGTAVMLGLSRVLKAAERHRWIRLHGRAKGSAAVAFGVMEDMFSGSRSQSRQLLEEQKRIGNRAPSPGDWLDDEPEFMGRFAGKLAVTVHEELDSRTRLSSSPVAVEPPTTP